MEASRLRAGRVLESSSRSADDPLSEGEGPRPAVVVLAVLLAVAVAYAASLDAPLLWDDLPLLEHPAVARLLPLKDYLFVPFWDLREDSPQAWAFYRPLTTLSLALDHALHGRNVTGFHFTNLMLHLGNVASVFLLARRLRAGVCAAAMAALTWGLLPRLVESVTWVSGRTDELGAMGVLVALLVWQPGSTVRLGVASVIALVAMLGKEMGVAGALALAVGELWPRPTRRAWLRAVIPLGVLLGYLSLRTAVMGSALGGPRAVALSVAAQGLTTLEAIGRYAWMTVDPWQPATQIGVVGRPVLTLVALGVAVIAAALIFAWRWARHLAGLAAAVVVAAVLPVLLVSHLVPLPWVVVASDRVMYLPWALLAVGIAVGYSRLKKTRPARLGAGMGAFGLALSLLLVTRTRVALFGDEVRFWLDAVETTAAANWSPTLSLAELCVRHGLYPEALTTIELLDGRVARSIPTDLRPYRARALARIGRYEEAYRLYPAGALERRSPRDLVDQSLLALHLLKLSQADALAQEAERRFPQYERARQVRTTVAQVASLLGELDQEPRNAFQNEVARARLAMLSGRRLEAERAWIELFRRAELLPKDADEGFAFLAQFASPSVLDQAIGSYSSRSHASRDLVSAAEDRLRSAQQLSREWPRALRALERLRSEP